MTETETPDGGEAIVNTPTRSGFVALIGPTNAGKSTLVNRFVGAKVSIVSHKVQTTRAVMRGIAIHKNAQIVFMDTPGIFKPRRRLDRFGDRRRARAAGRHQHGDLGSLRRRHQQLE